MFKTKNEGIPGRGYAQPENLPAASTAERIASYPAAANPY